MKTALITGITGQDGAYLSDFLLKKGYKVYGAYRRSSRPNNIRFKYFNIEKDIELIEFELTEFSNIIKVIEKIAPDEIYNLAAQSFVSVAFEQPIFTSEVNGIGVLRLLEAIRMINPKIKFFQASSTDMFGCTISDTRNEEVSFKPNNPYSISKLFAHNMVAMYREAYGISASTGILFNHESPLRGDEFVTKKISKQLARIKHGKQTVPLELGNLDSKRDWSHAKDFVEAYWMIMQHDIPSDYVLCSGKLHTIRDFVMLAAKECGFEIEWHGQGVNEVGIDKLTGDLIIRINEKFYRPTESNVCIGDISKIQKETGWSPKTSFQELASEMIKYDLVEEA